MEETMARLGRVLSAAMVIGATASMSPVSVQAQTPPRSVPQARPASASAVSSTKVTGGAISGIVNDEQGGPLRGATVSAIGPGAMAAANTDQNGRFSIGALPAGEYIVRAHMPGFLASRREAVRVGASTATVPLLQLTRIDAVPPSARTEAPLKSRPIVAAGFQLPHAAEETKDSADGEAHPHSELAWRLRHIKRSILKDDTGSSIFSGADPEIPSGSMFGRAVDSATGFASSLFADLPLNGEVNLLTSGAFAPGDLFSNDTLPHGIAYIALAAPAFSGDWAVRAAMSEGDLSSWIVAGSFTSRPGPVHSYNVGLSYSMQEYQGGNPAALAAMADGSRNAGEIFAFDRWALASWLSMDYGARYARYGYLETQRGLISPRLGFTMEPLRGTRLSATMTQRMVAPGAEEFLPRAMTGPALPPERTFAPFSSDPMRAERARSVSFGIEHDFDGAYVLGIRRFYQDVDDQLVTMFRVSPVGEPQSVGHYYVANGGAVDASGWGMTLSTPAGARMSGSIDYSVTRAHWLSRNAALGEIVPATFRSEVEDIHDITTSLHTDIPETATRFYVLYRVNTAFTRANASSPRPGIDGRFDVQVNQALPFGLAGTKWEVLVGVRNLFHDANDPGSVYDELLVVRPPKRVIGGVLVRF
jgi:carboxypeptidase family protein/TonB-dependent receptor-like protein